MSALERIYQEIILDHNRSTKNKGELAAATAVERGHNPNCGDDLSLMLEVKDEVVVDAKFQGLGCAISTASMSIMIDLIKGKTVTEAKALSDDFFKMLKGEALEKNEKKALKDAVIFENLKDMPARIKCGTLAWHCLDVALNKELASE